MALPRTVLCYGDSNTYGHATVARPDSRYAPDNPWRPFCSERCRSVDLGAWASESYRVEAPPSASDDEA